MDCESEPTPEIDPAAVAIVATSIVIPISDLSSWRSLPMPENSASTFRSGLLHEPNPATHPGDFSQRIG